MPTLEELTDEEIQAVFQAADEMVDLELEQGRKLGLPFVDLMITNYVARAATRVMALARHCKVPPDQMYSAFLAQGVVGSALCLIGNFAEPTWEDYERLGRKITKDFALTFGTAAATLAKDNVRMQ